MPLYRYSWPGWPRSVKAVHKTWDSSHWHIPALLVNHIGPATLEPDLVVSVNGKRAVVSVVGSHSQLFIQPNIALNTPTGNEPYPSISPSRSLLHSSYVAVWWPESLLLSSSIYHTPTHIWIYAHMHSSKEHHIFDHHTIDGKGSQLWLILIPTACRLGQMLKYETSSIRPNQWNVSLRSGHLKASWELWTVIILLWLLLLLLGLLPMTIIIICSFSIPVSSLVSKCERTSWKRLELELVLFCGFQL